MGERHPDVLVDLSDEARDDERSLRAVRLLAAGFVGMWVAALAAAGLGVDAVGDLLAAQGKLVFLAGLVLILVVRGAGSPADRTSWWCFAAAVFCYLGGASLYEFHYRGLDVVPRPAWSDIAYLGFFPLAFAAFLLLLRARVGRPTASMWLDVLVTGCTAAAVAAAAGIGAQLQATDGSVLVVTTAMLYPIGDLLLLSLIAGGLVLIGRGAGPGWWWVTAGLGIFVVTDTVYAYQSAHGTYVVGGPLDIAWGLAFVCCGMAATQRTAPRTTPRPDGGSALLIPGVCSLVALALLFRGYLGPGDPVAGGFALVAVLAALARTGLTFRDVRALADSRRQARTDELTGLPNRRSVFEALGAADLRLSEGERTAVLVIDLDRFKEINDSLGHAVGDALLAQVGPRLRGQLRTGDVLARLGGDEFVVLADDLDADGAQLLADRLRAQLQRPFAFSGMGLSVDASVGVAVGPEDSASAAELLQLADLAMYSAKSTRSGVATYDEDRDGHGRHRLEDVAQLRRAIEGGELVLHYQPKLALPTGRVDGVEALVRWQHPTRGLLYPDAFIDLAESAGLMAQLTDRVVDVALAQCRAWADRGRRLTMAVNVSPSNLVDEEFPDQVRALLARYDLPAACLVLEVTESLLMEDRERAVRVLRRLRDDGVGVAIDDYGTGYSSLAYLAALPVTELKLDRIFVGAMTGSPRAESIVTSTLQLAHALGLVLVAEGAEDQDTVDALAGLGCDVVQGYHLSRPLPAEALWTWLEDRSRTSVR
ncbi:putative bifunctional diguanylate cyclase/phosphodiesterase [Candidatus Blastococcus massiliensis]|uniref:putative bifunctional diguanylate cyclase/phosphodiesterase n=1 Tax=Candidatus Blastococcus massiliensis TaxID=1470358 RepID=UPI0004BCEF44|nr:EAL domain-containing protein [Candidatus Blastococcus massiliensis]